MTKQYKIGRNSQMLIFWIHIACNKIVLNTIIRSRRHFLMQTSEVIFSSMELSISVHPSDGNTAFRRRSLTRLIRSHLQTNKACSTEQGGRTRWDGYIMLSFTLFLLRFVVCCMTKTGDEYALLQDSSPFAWKSLEFLSSFSPNNSGFTLLLETKLIKDDPMAFP